MNVYLRGAALTCSVVSEAEVQSTELPHSTHQIPTRWASVYAVPGRFVSQRSPRPVGASRVFFWYES